MFVDSHAHITADAFASDRDEVIRRAVDAGVEYIINPGTDLEDSRKAVELADKHPGVFACVGYHPHEASKASEKSLLEIEELSKHPKVVGIGEIGLDFHYNFSPPDRQEAIFIEQIKIAQRRNLPIVIHTREAMELYAAHRGRRDCAKRNVLAGAVSRGTKPTRRAPWGFPLLSR